MSNFQLNPGRSTPRAPFINVKIGNESKSVPTGTLVNELLPREMNGALVVAALLGQKPVSLDTPLVGDVQLAPLTMAHWEGRKIFSRSAGLVILEAGRRLWPDTIVRLGPSHGRTQIIQFERPPKFSWEEIARKLSDEVARLTGESLPIRRELWLVEEAIGMFKARNWNDAASALLTKRDNTVALVAFGDTYALAMGPMLAASSELNQLKITASNEHLLLDLGPRDLRQSTGAGVAAEKSEKSMAQAHRGWLSGMGLESIGDFGRLCINGQVSQLIRVSEGFQEKKLGEIADNVARSGDRIRIIAVAGPSSSGKTTFLKRLNIQLQINGVTPLGLSIDNYYIDRAKTKRDANGEYDFEAIEALDVPLLQSHVKHLLEGRAVKVARYDFLEGRSYPEGGPLIQLLPGNVLVMEGIHGLNPRLLGESSPASSVFKIFIQPTTNLAVDRLSRISATDLRLLRRIVRDRYQRGYSAAENIMRWASVQDGEQKHIFPFQSEADAVFDSSLIYELSVLKVYAERYLLEVPQDHPAYPTAHRLRLLIDQFVSIYPDHVPAISLLREFIGGSSFEH